MPANLRALCVNLPEQTESAFLSPPRFESDAEAPARLDDFAVGYRREVQWHAFHKMPGHYVRLLRRMRFERLLSCRSNYLAFVERSSVLRVP